MSHVVTIETQVRDPVALNRACTRLGHAPAQYGTHQLFSREIEGLGLRLPDWRFPVVVQLDSGTVQFDNFEGRWGDRRHLDQLLQVYAVEKTRIEALKQGHTATEQSLPDGSIKVTIHVGGGE